MKLTDISPLENWIRIEKKAFRRSGLTCNFFDVDGIRTSDFHEWPNSLCKAIKATDKGQSFICAVAHMNLAAMAAGSGERVIEECDAGLVKLVIPVIVRDRFIGAFGACGYLLDNGEADSFLINKITEIETEEVEALASGLPAVKREDLEALAEWVSEEIAALLEAAGR